MTPEPPSKRQQAIQAFFFCFAPDARSEDFDIEARRFVSLVIEAAKEEIRAEQVQRVLQSDRARYVVRVLMPQTQTHTGAPGRWYVCEPCGVFHLHRDGAWRIGVNTYDPDDPDKQDPIPTGFYASKVDAEAALDAALAAGVVPPR